MIIKKLYDLIIIIVPTFIDLKWLLIKDDKFIIEFTRIFIGNVVYLNIYMPYLWK